MLTFGLLSPPPHIIQLILHPWPAWNYATNET